MESLNGGHGDGVAYVLGALDSQARASFELHAASCQACRREVDELRSVADSLALSVPQIDPPPSLRRRLILRAQTQSTPTATLPLAATTDGHSVAPTAVIAKPRPWWLQWERLAVGVATVSLLVAAVSSGSALAMHLQLQQTTEAAVTLGETLSIMYEPGMVARTLTGTEAAPQAKGKVFLVPDRKRAVIMAYDLPRLKQNESYQCWLVNEAEGRVDGGTFTVDREGRGHRIVESPRALKRFDTLGVTREPASGSSGPTGPRVLRGEL